MTSFRIAWLLPAALLAAASADVAPPAHEVPARSGHPRLFFTADEVPALRAKVVASGSFSRKLFDEWVANATPTRPARYVPGYVDNPDPPVTFLNDLNLPGAYHAPFLAVLHWDAEERRLWARYAIETSLALIRNHNPPYPAADYLVPGRAYWGHSMNRWVALTYDCCYDQLTSGLPGESSNERAEFQEEMQKICSSVRFDLSEGNLGEWANAGLGLSALALDGDIASGVTRTIVEEPVVHRDALPGDILTHMEFDSNAALAVRLSPGGPALTKGLDFDVKWVKYVGAHQTTISGYAIGWLAFGQKPLDGQTFYVTYPYTPNVPRWKEYCRRMIQVHFDRLWHDGAPSAGSHYGGVSLWAMVDLVEAFRLNAQADFSTHPCLKGIASWMPTELLHDPAPGKLRCNPRNENYISDLNSIGLKPYMAWAMKAYPGEADKAGVANWLLRRSAVAAGSWHLPLWATEEFGGAAAPAPAPQVPLSRFFRGQGLANFRTGSWDGPSNQWSLLSMNAGPWMGEHEHLDKGAFTFSALGTDWAADNGYARNNDDTLNFATCGHNYLLIDDDPTADAFPSATRSVTGGQPGPFSHAEVKSCLMSGFCDVLHADLRRSWQNSDSLAQDPATWPVRRAERFMLLMKTENKPPYAVIADAINKDGAPHRWTWLMHMGPGNGFNMFTPGFKAWDPAGNALRGYLCSPGSAGPNGAVPCNSIKQMGGTGWRSHTDNYVGHEKVFGRVQGVADPRFLAVLVPGPWLDTDPNVFTVTRSARPSTFSRANVDHRNGQRDVVILNDAEGVIHDVDPGLGIDLETDATLCVVRTGTSNVCWTVQNGTYLKWQGQTLWNSNAVRGDACYDGVVLSVGAEDVIAFQALAPGVLTFRSGDCVLPATSVSGGVLTWRGTRSLNEVRPLTRPAIREDFSTSAPKGWNVLNAGRDYTRVADGKLCVNCSDSITDEWVSWTVRPIQPPRADLVSQDAFFGNFKASGEFSIESAATAQPLTLFARVRDRSFSSGVDQDDVRVEVFPASGQVILSARINGTVQPIASTGISPLSLGTMHPYVLQVDGSQVKFTLDGNLLIQATSALPGKGYFQWKVPQGMHVHLDNLRVDTFGGTTLPDPEILPPAPTITAMSPASGPLTGGTRVLITGSGFQAGASVLFGGVASARVTVSNSTSLVCLSPARTQLGNVSVVVRNPDGQSSAPASYTYTKPLFKLP